MADADRISTNEALHSDGSISAGTVSEEHFKDSLETDKEKIQTESTSSDEEKGGLKDGPKDDDKEKEKSGDSEIPDSELPKFSLQRLSRPISRFYHKYTILFSILTWCILTAYLGAALALRKVTQLSDVLPLIFVYAFISLKIFFHYIPCATVFRPVTIAFDALIKRPIMKFPRKVRIGALYLLPIVSFVIVALCLKNTVNATRAQRLQGLLGMFVIIATLAFTSKYPSRIPWHTVAVGQTMQLALGLIVLKTSWGYSFFRWLADTCAAFLHFGSEGGVFIFGAAAKTDPIPFCLSVFPALIFFASFIQMMYYLGAMQWLVGRVSLIFNKLMDTSGAESIVAAGSPFVGQSENAMLVKSYLNDMTESELHTTMCAGFSTISGSVLMGYISMGVDPQWLITASVMSVPCSLAMSKIRIPEIGHPLTKGQSVMPPNETEEENLLHAAGNGASTGVMLALLIGGSLIAIISLVAFVNFCLRWMGNFISIDDLSLEKICGYLFYPFTWLLGIPGADIMKTSRLLGLKIVSNEFVAYQHFSVGADGKPPIKNSMSPRAQIITQFALAGFANFSSIGIQIGSIGAMIPNRKGELARLAMSAMITGAIATCMSALIAGIVL